MPKIKSDIIKLPINFVENIGQLESNVKYYFNSSNFSFYFTKEELVIVCLSKQHEDKNEEILNIQEYKAKDVLRESPKVNGVAISLKFMNANKNVEIHGQVKGIGKINYYKSNDNNGSYTDINTYEKIIYKNIWNNIDLAFYNLNSQLKYDYIVHPGGNIEDIKILYSGLESLEIDETGNLIIKTPVCELIDSFPLSYQEINNEKVLITCKYKLEEISKSEILCEFSLQNNYNKEYPLIIDPDLIYSSHLGGKNKDVGYGIDIDSNGFAYITGQTYSTDFPITFGAFQTSLSGNFDAFVTKINPTGSELIYSTFIGGSGEESAFEISVDSNANAYITGETNSSNFPTTEGAFQEINPSYRTGLKTTFITKLSSKGKIIYSTYLGGLSSGGGRGIVVDLEGNAYVTGDTLPSNFPTTPGAYQSNVTSNVSIFISKLNPNGSNLVYSTHFGGSAKDESHGISIDSNGNAYVTGMTYSSDFPTTIGAFQTEKTGESVGAYVTKINSDGSNLIYSTYLSGSHGDSGTDIDVDSKGNAYIVGWTTSSDFPTTKGAFQESLNGLHDAFITKINSIGTKLMYSTYLGGNNVDIGYGIVVDSKGNAYVTGRADSKDFPTTIDAYQPSQNGSSDLFITKISKTGKKIIYSTFIGGRVYSFGYGIAIDSNGNAFITGENQSYDYPITPNAFQTKYMGGNDAIVSKISTSSSKIDKIKKWTIK